jgi:hypothetical protein
MRYFLFIKLFICPLLLSAQLHDNTWFLGYSNNKDTADNFGISVLTFNTGNVVVRQNTAVDLNFNNANTSFSDSVGDLLSYSNAVHIVNKNGSIMAGAEFFMEGEELAGSPWPQIIMALPSLGSANYHHYIYQIFKFLPGELIGKNLYYGNVNEQLNNGLGALVQKDILIAEDSFSLGNITAVKHANGRDWWILMNEFNTNRYYRILYSPIGFTLMGIQVVGSPIRQGVGQVAFSPDGTHFANYYYYANPLGGYLELYDFDRCTGLLSNHRSSHITDGSWGGIAFSPNSRYLYFNNSFKAYQYDFQASDVLASRVLVAEWDGSEQPFPTRFFMMQLAPDGKIYSATTTGCYVLHVIHRPDEAGMACQYEQNAIRLPTYNAHSIPNFPYYRLGPLDGSACDTLGLDNHPVAWFRYDGDTLDPLSVAFRDISYYEPNTWSWDFGDGGISTERHPSHRYAQPGVYEVCLKVSNINSSHTHCKTLYLGVSAQDNPVLQNQIEVTPNPFSHRLSVALSGHLRSPVLYLYDLTDRLVREQVLHYGISEINTAELAKGMYFWQVVSAGEVVKVGKAVKI